MRCSFTDRVCLCALVGLCSLAGCGKKQTTADSPSPAPAVNPHSVTLSWAPPSKSKVAGYHVYRALLHEKPLRLTDRMVLGTEYTDTTVEAGRTYTYYVTAVDVSGLEGVPSKGIEAQVPAAAPEASRVNH